MNNESKTSSPSGSTTVEPAKVGVFTPDLEVNNSSGLQQEMKSSPANSKFK